MNKGQINLKKQSQLHSVMTEILNTVGVPKGIAQTLATEMWVVNEKALITNQQSLLTARERMNVTKRFQEIEKKGFLYLENSIYCYSVNIPPFKFMVVFPADLEQPIKLVQTNKK